jgi:hypothetical protein
MLATNSSQSFEKIPTGFRHQLLNAFSDTRQFPHSGLCIQAFRLVHRGNTERRLDSFIYDIANDMRTRLELNSSSLTAVHQQPCFSSIRNEQLERIESFHVEGQQRFDCFACALGFQGHHHDFTA